MREKKIFSVKPSTDIELIKKLHTEIFPADEWYSNPIAVHWIVWLDKTPLGFCTASISDENFGFLARAGLKKEARGKGLHQRLIRVRERFIRKSGFTKVITYTKIYNITSSRNLQKSGYQMYIPEYEYADKDCIYWYKDFK